MRVPFIALIVAALVTPAAAGPGIGISKESSLTGTGSSTSPLGLMHCVTTGNVLTWNAGTSSWQCSRSSGGAVTDVDTLAPLQGGPITSTGTVSLALCPANQLYKVNGGGTAWACGADAGITGTITSGDLIAATGTSTVGNYAGSSPAACGAGNATTAVSIGATGALTNTCSSLATLGAASGTGTVNHATKWSNTSGGEVDTSIVDDGTTVSTTEDTGTSGMLWAGGASSNRAVYFGSSSNATIGARYNSNSVQALNINIVGYLGGTTQNRNLFVGDGMGNTVFSVVGATKVTEFVGPVALDTHIGTSGTAPTLSSCGTSPAITGTDTAGQVTLGTTSSGSCTLTFANAYTSTPACTITLVTAGTATQVIGSLSNTALTVRSATDTSGSKFFYICIGNPN